MDRPPIDQKELQVTPETKSLHRGVWAEHLKNNQELPVGGSMFSKELTIKVKLDFEHFADQLDKFTEENVRALYEQSKAAVSDWLSKVGSDVDPYLFYVAQQVMQKMQKLLEVDPQQPNQGFARKQKYNELKTPLLSELKGKTMCAEQAALGQFLLQRAGFESAYVGGVAMQDAKDQEEWPEEHSFLVVKNPNKPEETFIFDIARPRSQQNIARVLKPAVPFNYDLLTGKSELLVQAKEVLQGGALWFGVGEPVCGEHDMIEDKAKTE